MLAAVGLLFGCSEKKSEPSSSEESSAVSEEVTEAETDPELQGVKRLNVFTWVEEMNMSLPMETTFDGEVLCCTADRLGTYALVDMEMWMDGMGITPEDLQSGE